MEPIYDTELDLAIYVDDWKAVAERLEKEGRVVDAKRVRNSLPYCRQAAREEWVKLQDALLDTPLAKWMDRMLGWLDKKLKEWK